MGARSKKASYYGLVFKGKTGLYACNNLNIE